MSDMNLATALSLAEIDELQLFLDRAEFHGKAMDLCMLEGYAAALVVGPEVVMPSQWLAWVWDTDDGEYAPEFESIDQAQRINGLVVRHYNSVARAFMQEPIVFEPMFRRDVLWDSQRWCEGFLQGLMFAEERWLALQNQQLAWFTPFVMLSELDTLPPEETEGGYIERWETAVAPTLIKMHAHWRQQRERRPAGILGERFSLGRQQMPVRRETPKTGRNDACPCGSGKKFKKCCGQGSALH